MASHDPQAESLVGTSGAVYCSFASNTCSQRPACSSKQRLLVHHSYSYRCYTVGPSLFNWLLLSSLALLLLSVTLTSATSQHSADLCEGSDLEEESTFCTAKSTSTTMGGDAERERTFIMIKPDGVQRGLVGEIIKRFESKGFHLVSMKMMWVS